LFPASVLFFLLFAPCALPSALTLLDYREYRRRRAISYGYPRLIA
jgi:hypothetical protein